MFETKCCAKYDPRTDSTIWLQIILSCIILSLFLLLTIIVSYLVIDFNTLNLDLILCVSTLWFDVLVLSFILLLIKYRPFAIYNKFRAEGKLCTEENCQGCAFNSPLSFSEYKQFYLRTFNIKRISRVINWLIFGKSLTNKRT